MTIRFVAGLSDAKLANSMVADAVSYRNSLVRATAHFAPQAVVLSLDGNPIEGLYAAGHSFSGICDV